MKYDYNKIASMVEDKYNGDINSIDEDGIQVDEVNLKDCDFLQVKNGKVKVVNKSELLKEWLEWKENN